MNILNQSFSTYSAMKQILCYLLFLVCFLKLNENGVKGQVKTSSTEDAPPPSPSFCEEQIWLFLQNYLNPGDNSWASTMLAASSNFDVGNLAMGYPDMGNFDQCIRINVDQNNTKIRGKYCLGYFTSVGVEEHRDSKILKQQINLRKNLRSLATTTVETVAFPPYVPTIAKCIPDACTIEDVDKYCIHFGPQVNFEFPEMFCQTEEDTNPSLSPEAIVTICLFGSIVLLMFVSSVYDIYCHRTKQVPMHRIYIAFSVYTNCEKLFKIGTVKSDQLPCLNGIRFLSMLWVIIGHTYSIGTSGPVANVPELLEWTDQLRSMLIVSGTISVDTFFVVGSCLLVYGFMKSQKQGVRFNLPLFYLHRYIRLTPPLGATMLVSASILKYLGSGPYWPYVDLFYQEPCRKYWWSALLYVQNYVNNNNMCLGQTWYLDIDMQLYFLSPFLLFLLLKFPREGFGVLFIGVLVFMATPFIVTWQYELPGILSNLYNPASTDFAEQYYLLTHTRAAPWFIGCIFGYIIYLVKYHQLKFRVNKVVVLILWVITLSGMLGCIFGGHSTLRGEEYDKWGNAFHVAFMRPSWSLCVGMVILLCVTNAGGPINWLLSLPIFQVLNRFTYSMYLIHVTLGYLLLYSMKIPLYFSEINMAYSFWGLFMFTFILSFFWILAFESPMIVIENILFGGKGKSNKNTFDFKINGHGAPIE